MLLLLIDAKNEGKGVLIQVRHGRGICARLAMGKGVVVNRFRAREGMIAIL